MYPELYKVEPWLITALLHVQFTYAAQNVFCMVKGHKKQTSSQWSKTQSKNLSIVQSRVQVLHQPGMRLEPHVAI